MFVGKGIIRYIGIFIKWNAVSKDRAGTEWSRRMDSWHLRKTHTTGPYCSSRSGRALVCAGLEKDTGGRKPRVVPSGERASDGNRLKVGVKRI